MNWTLLANSLATSVLASTLAGLAGFAAALSVMSLGGRWRILAFAVAALAFAMPPFLVTSAWLDVLAPSGAVHRLLPFKLASVPGVALLLGLFLWPLPMFACIGAWQQLGRHHVETDPALRGLRIVRWLLLPSAIPALGTALMLTFVLALNNFAVAGVLQVKVLPVEVYVLANTNLDYGHALLLSWPLVMAPLLLLACMRRRRVSWPRLDRGVAGAVWRTALGWRWIAICGLAALATAGLAVVLPLVAPILSARTWEAFGPVWATAQDLCLTSFFTAAGSATLAILIGLVMWRTPIGFLSWVLFLVPGVVLGIVLIKALNRPPFLDLYRSTVILLIALTLRYLAVGRSGAIVARRSVDRDLTDAARLDGASGWQTFRHVHWPQMRVPLAAAWYVAYLLCLWDVETAVFVVPPGRETLPLRIFNLLHYGHNPQINALCLLLLALAVLPPMMWILLRRFAHRHNTAGAADVPLERDTAYEIKLRAQASADHGSNCAQHRGFLLNDLPRNVLIERPGDPPIEVGGCVGGCVVSSAKGHGRGWSGSCFDRGLCMGLITAVEMAMLMATGCSPTRPPGSGLNSRVFRQVEIIGSRGTAPGQFNKPRSLTLDRQNNLYVADMTGRIQKFAPDGTWLLSWQMPETDVGRPKGMGIDKDGFVIVVEPHYARINHYDSEGTLVRQWGERGTNRGQLAFPRAVVANRAGELFVSEYGAVDRIQRFSPDGLGLLSVIGSYGHGPSEFNRPEGLGIDRQDRLYVADSCNHRIQVFAVDGRRLRSHGRPGRQRGEMSYPYDVCVDANGNEFVCEFGNSRIQVFDAEGNAVEVIGGPGRARGQFSNPWSLALDLAGNLYVADAGNDRVQKFIRREPLITQR